MIGDGTLLTTSPAPGPPVARRLLRELRAARPAVVAIGVVAVLTAAAILVQAALLAGILARGFSQHPAAAALAPALVALVAATLARALLAGAFDLAGRRGAIAVMSELRGRVAGRLLAHPLQTSRERSGELATAAVQGIESLEAWFARYLPQAALAACVPPAILVLLAVEDATAAGVLAITVPVLIAFLVLVGLAARARTRSRWRALALLGAHFSDVVRGLPELRAHAREGAQLERMDAMAGAYRRETMGTLRVAFLSAFVLELVAMVGTGLVAATVGLQLVAGHLALREGLLVLILAPELYAPLRAVGQQFHAGADGLAAAERLLALLDAEAGDAPARGSVPPPDPRRHAIELRGVDYAHPGRAAPALRGVSLDLAPGETVALVGSTGAGKSTLAALLLRLADPGAGTITCGGVDLRDTAPEAWRRRVAWLPQHPLLVAGTVAENIALARPGASPDAIHAAAATAGADALVAALPHGYATRVGDGGRPLSAGQAQRICLARAVLADAWLLVLDEPTAHLDAATAAALDGPIAAACAGRTALLITHRPELAARADRTLRLEAGRIVVAAAPAEAAA